MDAFALAAKLTLDSKDFERDLGKQEGVFKQFGGKLSGAMSTIGKVGAVAMDAAVTAVGGLTKSVVDAYKNYEQLVGGVETLFGIGGKSLKEFAKESGKTQVQALNDYRKVTEGQRKVLQNAKQAYKTAGLSMNKYMETVTSFSASLIQSLEGDQIKAAKVADKAIIDMSDNANKMGTSMEAIQNAYQGFAKQNYTMLDNLKLGYGGTKTEMERLIADANKLKEANGEMADLSIERFSDIVEAIHLIQDEMGITGTTAKEAATTIEGSLGMLRASWENLVTALGDGNADLDFYISQVVDSAETAFKNLVPVIENALKGIGKFVEKIAPIIAEELPGLVTDALPSLLNAAVSIIEGIINALPALFSTLFTAIGNIDWLGLGTSVWNTIKGAFSGIAGWFSEKFTEGKNAVGSIEWAQVGHDILDKLGSAFAGIADWFKEKFDNATVGLLSIDWKTAGTNIMTQIGTAFLTIKSWFQEQFLPGPDGISQVDWKGAGTSILTFIGQAFASITDFFNGLFSPVVGALTDGSIDWGSAGQNILDKITAGIGSLIEWGTKVFSDARTGIESIDWYSVGTQLRLKIETAVVGIINWFNTTFGNTINNIKELGWTGLGESIKGFIEAGLAGIDDLFTGIFGQGWQTFKDTAAELEPILSGIGGALVTIKGGLAISSALSSVKNGFSKLGGVLNSHPILTIAGVIAGIGTALWKLYNTNEEFREKVDYLWGRIQTMASTAWNAVKTAITTAIESIRTSWNAVKHFFTETIPEEWQKFQSKAEAFFAPVKNVIDGAIQVIKSAWDAVKELFTVTIPGVWNQFSQDATVFDGIKGVIDGAIRIISTAWGDVEKFFTTTIPDAWNKLKDDANAIIKPVQDIIEGVVGAVQSFINWWKQLLGLNGSKDFIVTTTYTTIGQEPSILKEHSDMMKGTQKGQTHLTAVSNTGKPIGREGNVNVITNARSMFGGTILRGASLFGWDNQGRPQIGGSEGPEAVVGVGSLKQQIREAVRSEAAGLVSGIAGALSGNSNQPIYVVLDTGELVGAIGPKMDAKLGEYGDWKGGGRA